MENNKIQLTPNQSPEIKPISNFNTFKYLFILFFILFLITLGVLLTLISDKNKIPDSQSDDQVLPTQVVEVQTSVILEILDLQFDLPSNWKVESVIENKAKILTDYPEYQVYLTLDVGKNTKMSISDYLTYSADSITTDYGQVYKVTCIGGSLTCTGALIYGNKYTFYWDIESNQPAPTNLDGIWRPDHSITREILLDITKTVKPLNLPSQPITPTSTQVKKLSYTIPSSWQTTSDQSNSFQVSYDPNTYKVLPYDSRIDLSSNTCCSSIFIKLLPYDGGSRHQFISTNIVGVENKPTTQEINYQINSKPGLFLYDIDYSGTNSVGMIVANSNQAWLIESQSSNINLIESIISTLKLN